MTNLEWIKTLSAKELSDLLYDYWLPRGQYVWTDSRKGLIKVLEEDYLERDCNKCKHQGNCYCVKGFGCPFELKDEPQTIRCPKCGRTDYIRDMKKDMGIKGSCYKYKCINCNTYIKDEPQTEVKGSKRLLKGKDESQTMYYPQVDGITPNVINSKDKPQVKVKRGCIYCKEKEGCINAFTEISQYCGNYEQTEMNE